ncbi:MAG: DUF3488 and transglutaminase-like domain-containing protein [Gemmataceae bacterium]
MTAEMSFRRSSYLTLAIASSALAQAESIFFPEMALFVVPVLMALALAYVFDGRWAMSNLWANLIGLGISIGFGVWIAHQLVHFQARHGIVAPWWVMIMPFFGPVLMVLMLVKLFQPKKLQDYWMLHFIGLMQVILGCVLASELYFGLLVLAYLVSGLWTLVLFYQARGVDQQATTMLVLRRDSPARPARPVRVLRSLGWAACAGMLAFLLFLVTPHLGDDSWDPFTLSNHRFLITGIGSGMDLNRVGSVRTSDRPAFVVSMRDTLGRPRVDLGLEEYWRASIMSTYDRGRWFSRTQTQLAHELQWGKIPLRPGPLADLGSAQYFATFTVDTQKVGVLPLADPVALPEDPYRPTAEVLTGVTGPGPLFRPLDGTLVQSAFLVPGEYVYRQVTVPAPVPGYGPNMERATLPLETYLQQPVRGIETFTFDLVRQLRDAGKLPEGAIAFERDGAVMIAPEHGLAVGRILADHLARSGQYSYTLNLRRQDVFLDPTEDFLCNVKAGHCGRYASALTLMLRSLGVPARVVIGYHGGEPTDEPGVFVIKQNQAHSWVEVLALEHGDAVRCRWVRLEPTPADDGNRNSNSLWATIRKWSVESWYNYLLDYDTSRRNELFGDLATPMQESWQHVQDSLAEDPTNPAGWLELSRWLALPALLLLGWFLWRRRRGTAKKSRRALSRPVLACYHRLLRVLGQRFGIAPQRGQTPLEFAAAARTHLLEAGLPGALVELPEQVVGLLYRVQYDRELPGADECAAMDQRVAELEAALQPEPSI